MNWDFVGPLSGVALGWVLTELGGWVKDRKAQRRALGLLVAELYQLHWQLGAAKDQVLRRLGRSKEENDNDPANAFLSAALAFLENHDRLIAAIDEAKKQIAATDPIAATRLDGVRAILEHFHDVDPARASDEKWKSEFLVTFVNGVDDHERQLAELVLMLAQRHGLITWLRVKRSWKRRVRDTGGWTRDPKVIAKAIAAREQTAKAGAASPPR